MVPTVAVVVPGALAASGAGAASELLDDPSRLSVGGSTPTGMDGEDAGIEVRT